MERKIIHINEEKCNGCALCAEACHEGAIGMRNGKAVLLRDDYCDGLGDCLPVCPTNAITFETREAAAYDVQAVAANIAKRPPNPAHPPAGGCPGSRAQTLPHSETSPAANSPSELMQWPVQIRLVPPNAPYFKGAKLLIAADCAAYAYANFHRDFIKNHITLVGCPKLDSGDWADKLTEIFRQNEIKSVTVARMEVPCCGGLESAVKQALQDSGKMIPWRVAVISTSGQLLED